MMYCSPFSVFGVNRGVREGGALSPNLFRYLHIFPKEGENKMCPETSYVPASLAFIHSTCFSGFTVELFPPFVLKGKSK